MPGKSWGINADRCITGGKLAKVAGTICSECYAQKGNYTRYPAVKRAQDARLDAFGEDPILWVHAMVKLDGTESYFRWFDSGDLQTVDMLDYIVMVCERTPNTKHWLATREFAMVQEFLRRGGVFPPNLVVRLSAMKYDQPIRNTTTPWSSMAHKSEDKAQGHVCPAPSQNGACGECRACWDTSTPLISYKAH